MWLIYKSSKSRSVPLQIHFYGGPCPLNKGEVEVSCKKYYWLVKEETIQTYDHSIADEDNFQCQCGCDTHRRHHLQLFYFSMDYRILNISDVYLN